MLKILVDRIQNNQRIYLNRNADVNEGYFYESFQDDMADDGNHQKIR